MTTILNGEYLILYNEYLEYKKKRVTVQGFESLEGRTRRFLKWFEDEHLRLEDVKVTDAIRYKKALSEIITKNGKHISTGTVLNYLKTARSFFKYLAMTQKIESNPFEAIKNPRLPEHISRNVLTEPQMNKLLDKFARYYEITNQEKAIRRYKCHVLCELLYSTGLRIAEAGNLLESNIDLKHHFVYVSNGKGNIPRIAFLTSYAADIIKQYLKKGRNIVIRNYNMKNSNLLFGVTKARLGAVLNEELHQVCTELEIPIITSHGFRHSLGTHLLKNGCDMRYIQVILGHERLGTTQIYTKVDKDDLRNSIDQHHPRQYINGGV